MLRCSGPVILAIFTWSVQTVVPAPLGRTPDTADGEAGQDGRCILLPLSWFVDDWVQFSRDMGVGSMTVGSP